MAAPERSWNFEIGARPLPAALNDFARVTGLSVVFTQAEASGAPSPGVRGRLTAEQALTALTAGTGFTWQRSDARTVTLMRVRTSDEAVALPEVRVDAGLIPPTAVIGPPPAAFAGGQVASGTRMGTLGNRSIFDTPFSTQGFTRDLMAEQQGRSLGDVLVNNPSIQTINPRTGFIEFYSIRGFTAGPGQFTFDGLNGVVPERMASILGVERVEVLLGASAVLNGLSPGASPGGTVNLVPARAGDAPLNRITGLYGSRSNFGALAEIGRRYGENNEFGVRGSFMYRDGESPVSTTGLRRLGGSLGLDYRGERFRMSLDGGFLNTDVNPPTSLVTIGTGFQIPNAPNGSKRLFPTAGYGETQGLYMASRAEYDVTDSVTAGLAYGRGYIKELGIAAGPTLLSSGGLTRYSPSQYELFVQSQTVEASLRARLQTGPVRHNAVLAVSGLWRDSGDQAATLGSSVLGNLYVSPDVPITARVFAGNMPRTSASQFEGVTLSDTASVLNDRVQLTLGLRQQRIRQESFDTSGARTQLFVDSALAPLAALLVKPTERLSLYGNYVEGLSVGPIAPVGAANAGQAFAPFRSEQYEIGAKYDFDQFAATLAGFQITQPSSFINPTTLIFGVDGETRTRGLELNLFGEPIAGTRILAGITHFDAEQVRTAGGVNDGKRTPGVPRYQATAYLEQDIAAVPGLTLTGRALYASGAFVDAAERQPLPSWTRFDIGARQTFRIENTRLTARFTVENVLDTDYWAARSSIAGQALVGAPRTYLFSLSAEF
ncbi:TonB-dependent receptor [Roseococcus sp. SDR]|uniref:TonB-dependent siderophore receptor n=1 Tax=Roseococcus sp. SDR TaxID=2835532 RepID=UPI001BD0786A|nr:TonB-dependent receptor [Roseococcus sp. SDR]MBV1847650.1 TonB-dependent receptor [Roseococcus sp. SDR]